VREALSLYRNIVVGAEFTDHRRYFILLALSSIRTCLLALTYLLAEFEHICFMLLNQEGCLVLFGLLKFFFELDHLHVVRLGYVLQVFFQAGGLVHFLLNFLDCRFKSGGDHLSNSVLKTDHQSCSLLSFHNFGGVGLLKLFDHCFLLLLHL